MLVNSSFFEEDDDMTIDEYLDFQISNFVRNYKIDFGGDYDNESDYDTLEMALNKVVCMILERCGVI
jgi:hypothetical protein